MLKSLSAATIMLLNIDAVSLPGQPDAVQSQDAEATDETKEMGFLSERSKLDERDSDTGIAGRAVMLADGVVGKQVDDVQVEGTDAGNVVEEENEAVEGKEAQIQELVTGKVQTENLSAKMTQCGDPPSHTCM